MSCVYAYSQGQKDKVGSFKWEGYFCWIQQYIKGIESICPRYKKIEICRDVNFDEDATFYKSKSDHFSKIHEEEPEAPRISETKKEEHVPEDHDTIEP